MGLLYRKRNCVCGFRQRSNNLFSYFRDTSLTPQGDTFVACLIYYMHVIVSSIIMCILLLFDAHLFKFRVAHNNTGQLQQIFGCEMYTVLQLDLAEVKQRSQTEESK